MSFRREVIWTEKDERCPWWVPLAVAAGLIAFTALVGLISHRVAFGHYHGWLSFNGGG